MKNKRYCVVIRASYTQSQIGPPEWHNSMREALDHATEYNRFNQDSTWNHPCAYAIDVQSEGRF